MRVELVQMGVPRLALTPIWAASAASQAVASKISCAACCGWSQFGKCPHLANRCREAVGNLVVAVCAWLGKVTLSWRPEPITIPTLASRGHAPLPWPLDQ